MALIGNLQDFSLLQLFQLINQGRKTGCLTVENESTTLHLYFQAGKLACGYAVGQEAVFRDGLLRTGKLTQELDQYITASYRPVTEKGLALLLEESGILSRDEIIAQEASRLHETIDLISSWDGGSFRFDQGVLPPLGNITVALGLENLIMEASNNLQEIEDINSVVPDLDFVLRFKDQQSDKVHNVSLGADELKVIGSIDGKSNLRTIARTNGLDEFKVRKLVYGLVSTGLVDLARDLTAAGSAGISKDEDGISTPRKGIILRLIDRIRGI